MNGIRLWRRYVRILIRSQLEYRASFWMTVVSQFATYFLYVLGVFLLFSYFGRLDGWSFWEAALCTGIVQTAFPLAECFSRGFDSFSGLVRSGGFDTILLRPRSVILQVLGSRFEVSRAGRFAEGVTVIAVSLLHLPALRSPGQIALVILMVLGGTAAFTGVFVLGAAFAFFTVQGMELVNILSDGGREIAQYPMGIYKRGYLFFFTGVIPYACTFYWPLLYLTGRSANPWCAAAPLAGFVFLLPCAWVFLRASRHYRSTGS